jgi:hypothetical protein
MDWLTGLRRALIEASSQVRGELLVGLVAGVLVMVASTVWVVRWVARMPADYLVSPPPAVAASPPLGARLRRLGRNLAGAALLLAGGLMALPGVPGPGLATMFVGFALLDVPGKRRLELRLFRAGPVHAAINRLRARHGQPPLELPPPPEPPAPGAPPPAA